MNVYSIMYESMAEKGRIAMTTFSEDNIEKAHIKGLNNVIASYGQLAWVPRLITYGTIADLSEMTVAQHPKKEVALDKNWLMQTIISSKDIALLDAANKHLSQNEVSYIRQKLSL